MIRVGVVAYTNTLPLADGLESILSPLQVVRAVPGRLAEDLEAGRLDVGIVPVATLARHPEWPVVAGLGIASRGAVESVLLVSRKPLEDATRLIADPASRTSNILAALLLRERYGLSLEPVSGPEGTEDRLAAGEPTVVIGDRALFWEGEAEVRIDLGRAWTEWTGLPFVYAVWAGPGAGDPGVAEALHACYETNRSRLDVIAAREGGGDAERTRRIREYLAGSILHRLGEREERGLNEFFRRGHRAGLLPEAAATVAHAHTR